MRCICRSYTVCAFGNAAGRVVLAIGGVFTLLAAAQTARRAGIAFPDGTAELAGGVIVLLGTLAGEKDAKQAAKVCGVLFLVLAGLYTIILLAARKECAAAVDGAMGRRAADIGSGSVAACADVPAVFAGENGSV